MLKDDMLRVAQVATVCGGRFNGDEQLRFARVSIDSRDIQTGDLFVALTGTRVDGHDFVHEALAAGAVAAVVNTGRHWPADTRIVETHDTLAALAGLAAYWRSLFQLPLVAITGSNGKTTVKNMLAAILEQHCHSSAVLATAGNFNNHIGVPLTLLRLRVRHRFAVLEMGMNHFDEIRYLSHLAKPDIAVITNAGRAHLEHLGSTTAVARAKAEIFSGLSHHGIAVLPADDPHTPLWQEHCAAHRCVSFGLADADVYATAIRLESLHSSFNLHNGQQQVPIRLRLPGEHNVKNALAASAAALSLGVELATIAAGLQAYRGTPGRLQVRAVTPTMTLLDDSYNANPESLRAAIEVLLRQPGPRLLVLGDMGEIGPEAMLFHREAGIYAKQAGIDGLITLGEQAGHASYAFGHEAKHFASMSELIAALVPPPAYYRSILVKGSRFMHMEQIVDALMSTPQPMPVQES